MADRFVPDNAGIARMLSGADIKRDLAKRAVRVETTAKRLAPVDTGRLRSSITHEVTEDSKGPVAFVGTNVDYAIFVELGTRYMRPQPFLRPALRSAK